MGTDESGAAGNQDSQIYLPRVVLITLSFNFSLTDKLIDYPNLSSGEIDKLNIALITDTYRPQVNGVVNSIDRLAEELRKNNEVHIFAPTNVEGVTSFRSIPFYIQPEYRIALVQPNTLIEDFEERDIDIVHIHTPISLGYSGLKAADRLDIPSIGTFHTLLPEYTHYISENIDSLLSAIGWKYLSWFYDQFDIVTAPSEPLKEILGHHGLKNVKVIPNSVDVNRFSPGEYSTDEISILYVGRIGKEKRLEVLIGAANEIRNNYPEVTFRIVGKGPDREWYESLVEEKNITENFIFEGYLGDPELIKAYHECDIFVMPSDTETQGLVAIEAMACGKPVVGANARGLKNLITHGEDGYLFQPGNPKSLSKYIDKLLEDGELRKKMGEKARKKAEKFSTDRIGRKWIELYSTLLAR